MLRLQIKLSELASRLSALIGKAPLEVGSQVS